MSKTKAQPRYVDFSEILDACRIVPDYLHGAPWDEEDGWNHEVEGTSYQHPDQRYARGYCYSYRSSKPMIIVPDGSYEEDVYGYQRANGASKQVARERAALNRRRTLDQLVKWYEYGWEWYGVVCDFDDAHDSLWGIDSEDYAREVAVEIAENVAYELEQSGYVVLDKPDPRETKRKDIRERLRYQLHLQDWTD